VTILLHDGRRGGHATWLKETITAGLADGAILNPFATPLSAIPRHPSATTVIADLRDGQPPGSAGPEILFDSASWAATLPGTDSWQGYDEWDLWPHHARGDLSDVGAIADHVRAVFKVQAELGVPYLAPTVAIDTATGQAAETALELSAEASRQQPGCKITVCGMNSFWRAGPALDAYIGRLARLRASGCYVIPLRDRARYPADMTDTAALAGWLRSIHSLSLRSRVIAAYTDHLGVIAAAAGADTVGTGWDQGQRVCSPDAFRTSGPGGQNINYSPHPGLLARFTEAVARGLEDLASTFAGAMRWGEPIPSDMRGHREQHFRALNEQLTAVLNAGAVPADRYPAVRHMLTGADLSWDKAVALGAQGVSHNEKAMWLDGMRSGFEAYVLAER